MASLWMLFASFAFAAMGAGVKLAADFYSTSEIVMYRGLVGTLILGALIVGQRGTLRTAFAAAHLWRCLVGVVSLWLWFYAIGKLPLATAVTLNYLAPVWIAASVLVAGWWQGRKRIEWPPIAAIALSFGGVVLVLQPAVAGDQWLDGAVAVLSSVIAAMAYLQVRQLGKLGEPEYRVVFYFSLTMIVAGLFGTLLEARDAHQPLFTAHTGYSTALLLGVGASALCAQLAMTRAYRVGKVLVVANLQYTGIIFSSLWGMLLWGDRFDWHVWLGIAVILVSGLAATFYNTRSAPPAPIKTDPIASEL